MIFRKIQNAQPFPHAIDANQDFQWKSLEDSPEGVYTDGVRIIYIDFSGKVSKNDGEKVGSINWDEPLDPQLYRIFASSNNRALELQKLSYEVKLALVKDFILTSQDRSSNGEILDELLRSKIEEVFASSAHMNLIYFEYEPYVVLEFYWKAWPFRVEKIDNRWSISDKRRLFAWLDTKEDIENFIEERMNLDPLEVVFTVEDIVASINLILKIVGEFDYVLGMTELGANAQYDFRDEIDYLENTEVEDQIGRIYGLTDEECSLMKEELKSWKDQVDEATEK